MAEIRSQLPNESVEIPSRTRVVIVGGGVIGCSLAYHLAKAGWKGIGHISWVLA
jgi:glycine/D-amino acid oxidase-like deaminating enzyme